MGVAVITSRCGFSPFARRAARCATPKRCCSSTTASCKRWNCDRDFDQRVRADDQLDAAIWPVPGGFPAFRLQGYLRSTGGFLLAAAAAWAASSAAVPGAREQAGEGAVMLFGQDAGRGHHGGLRAAGGRSSRSPGQRPPSYRSRHRPGSGGPSGVRRPGRRGFLRARAAARRSGRKAGGRSAGASHSCGVSKTCAAALCQQRFWRSTPSWSRKISSKASRQRATSSISCDSGKWMLSSAVGRSTSLTALRTRSGR